MLNSHCKARSYKKKKHKKTKAHRKSLYNKPAVNKCLLILDLRPYPKTRTTEPSDGFLSLRDTSLENRLEVKHVMLFFVFLIAGLAELG